jgi:hypothetical protein
MNFLHRFRLRVTGSAYFGINVKMFAFDSIPSRIFHPFCPLSGERSIFGRASLGTLQSQLPQTVVLTSTHVKNQILKQARGPSENPPNAPRTGVRNFPSIEKPSLSNRRSKRDGQNFKDVFAPNTFVSGKACIIGTDSCRSEIRVLIQKQFVVASGQVRETRCNRLQAHGLGT